jgi:hypothetical protein
MRKIHVLLVAIAVFAFAAFTASSALAAHEWLSENESVTASLPVKITGELLLEETKVPLDILCSGTFVGTVLSNGGLGTGEITEVLGLGTEKVTKANELNETTGFINCTYEATDQCEEPFGPGKPAKVFPIHLPWATELMLVVNSKSEEEWVNLIKSGGNGQPGYEVLCKLIFIEAFGECTGETGALLLNEPSDVFAQFDETDELITPAAECKSFTGTGKTGLLGGSSLIEPSTAGPTLQVS